MCVERTEVNLCAGRYGEWFMELDWWWVEIPKSVRNDVSLCFSALSLHLANRLRFLSPRGGSAMSSPPPPVSGTNSEVCGERTPPRHGACLVSLARHSPPASCSTSSSLVPFVQACEWVRSKEGVEEHLPGLPDFPELPSEFRLPFPLPALLLLRPEWGSYVRSIRKWPHPLPSHSAHAQIHVSPLPFPPQGAAHGRDDSYQWSLLHCSRERC